MKPHKISAHSDNDYKVTEIKSNQSEKKRKVKRKVVHNSKIKGTFMCAHANNASILSLNYSHYPHHHHNCDRDLTLDLLEKD